MKTYPFRRSLLIAVLGSVIVSFTSNSLRGAAGNAFGVDNLVSDIPGLADHFDPNLANPWGISLSPTSPFWIADNGTGVSTLYNGAGQPFPIAGPLIVTIPPPAGGTPPAAPTGTVFNGGAGFEVQPGKPARFLFASEDGTISGWNPTADPTHAILKVDMSGSEAIYKGLAIGNNGSGDFIYAANFHGGTIDAFDDHFAPASLAGSFLDPNIPSGYAPFNIQKLGDKLYVTYALQDAAKEDDIAGPGNGYVSVFDLNGNLLNRLVSQGALNSPWGLAIAPEDFGPFKDKLLVGNFGDGKINVYDPATGNFIDTLKHPNGNPLEIEGLWALSFGNGGNGGDKDELYVTAGISGGGAKEDHGLFAEIATVPDSGSHAGFLLGIALVTVGSLRRFLGPSARPGLG